MHQLLVQLSKNIKNHHKNREIRRLHLGSKKDSRDRGRRDEEGEREKTLLCASDWGLEIDPCLLYARSSTEIHWRLAQNYPQFTAIDADEPYFAPEKALF